MEQAATFASTLGPILDLKQVIQSQSPRMALAAEFKRASPSKGDIALELIAGEQAVKYATAGANIVSVLTEEHWFQGTLADMKEVRIATSKQRPAILRKDFVIHKYMIAEAAAHGADTVLLIVAVLPRHLLKILIDFSRSIGMEPLVEVHAQEELYVALDAGAKVIGVNNRNLHTFQMDLRTTETVAQILRQENKVFHHKDAEYVICALSGMSTALDVDRYRQVGVGMCLIGESLMRAPDPSAAIASLCLDPQDFAKNHAITAGGGAYVRGTQLIKVCGITNAEDALVACQAGANLIGVIFAPNSKRCVTTDQAKQVVTAVRAFGERSARTLVSGDNPCAEQALFQLMAMSRFMEDASRRPMVVGVFQNQDIALIQQTVEECGLDLVQLHGQEGMAATNRDLTGVPTIRVVDVETDPSTGLASPTTVQDLFQSLTTDPAAILLDTSIKGAGGGTGVTFDWSICQKVQDYGLPVIIAGGLTPDNVRDAVLSVRPWGVDVSSGVEATPGKKDHVKVQDFCKGARDAAIEASKGF